MKQNDVKQIKAVKRNCVAEIASQSKTKLCHTRHNFTPFYMTMQSKFWKYSMKLCRVRQFLNYSHEIVSQEIILGEPVMSWAFLSRIWGITFKVMTHHSSIFSQLITSSGFPLILIKMSNLIIFRTFFTKINK